MESAKDVFTDVFMGAIMFLARDGVDVETMLLKLIEDKPWDLDEDGWDNYFDELCK